MKLIPKSGIRLNLFWQLILAFALVTLAAGAGIHFVARSTIENAKAVFQHNPPALQSLWADRLARYYEQHGSWDGVGAMIAGYPTGPGWEPWDETWQVGAIVTTAEGVIIAAPDPELIGQTLEIREKFLALPIMQGEQEVGLLFIPPLAGVLKAWVPGSLMGTGLWRFLFPEGAVLFFVLLVGVILSRGISRPLSQLTQATHKIAEGDLDTRVPVRYQGEARELARSFNNMAEALARSDELRRNMTADVAHELRTPLSVIRGKLEGILDGVYPATAEHLDPILEETALLTRLVEDLRLLAQAEAGQLQLDLRPLDISDLLHDAQVNFTPPADDRGVLLSLALPAELPEVRADGRRIAQVLGNLVSNALRHTPEGGSVNLSALAREGWVEVAVSDTGTGITPEELPYIFERFWRGDQSRSRAGGGTGLGLAIAKQIVALHGSDISVESDLGRGTTFRFSLPAG
ncbi:MAG: ATP-binding protein [Chloroflexota bacterium]|nr:ATP-binding protein [Chloroflexota bacterium]